MRNVHASQGRHLTARPAVAAAAVVAVGAIAGLLAVQSLALALGCLAVMGLLAALAGLDGWQRLWVLLLLLLFGATSSQPEVVDAVYYPKFAAGLLLAFWTWNSATTSVRLNTQTRAVVFLVSGLWLACLVSLLSALWSVDRVTTLLQATALGTLAWLVHGVLTRRWQVPGRVARDLGVASLTLATMFALGIVAEIVGVVPAIPGVVDPRFRGLFNNPQALGITAALVLPLLWALWRAERRLSYGLALVPTAISLVLCESRTAQVALLAGIVWVLVRERGLRTKAAVSLAAATCLVFLASALGVVRMASFTDLFARFGAAEGGDLLNTRTIAWNDAIQQWLLRPVEGYGYGAGPTLFDSLRSAGSTVFGSDVVHNSYIQWLLELGLLGLLPLAAVLGACAVVVLKGRLDQLGVGLVAAVVAGLLVNVTESAMFGTGQVYPYLFWLAVAGALVDRQRTSAGDGEGEGASAARPPTPRRSEVELRRAVPRRDRRRVVPGI